MFSAGLFQKGMSSGTFSELGREEEPGRSCERAGLRVFAWSQQTPQTAQTQQRFHRRKPPRAKVAQVRGDPVVRGKPFLNSVEKASIQQAPV